ncbi:MAG: hypothetical protein IK083_06215 [Abditibacteriota bacterium]|nr:hypothetical protein [Abditibacteriota bacterium]
MKNKLLLLWSVVALLTMFCVACYGDLPPVKPAAPTPPPKTGSAKKTAGKKKTPKKQPAKKTAANQKQTAKQDAPPAATGKTLKAEPRKRAASIASAKKGEVITFGRYEQDGNYSNGKEPIEWIVIFIGSDNSILVVSRYGLDCKPYNTYKASVTWATCSLRQWLNNDFYNSAFNADEKKRMYNINSKNYNNSKYGTYGGAETKDMVVLLSEGRASNYFSSDASRLCYPTKYARQRGVEVYDTGFCWCWLSTPGDASDSAAHIDRYGRVNLIGNAVNHTNVAVRPAIWIDRKTGEQTTAGQPSPAAPKPTTTAGQPTPATPKPQVKEPGDFTSAKPGDIIKFGRYKGEPIEWYVFKNNWCNWKDPNNPGLELISVKALDVKRFDLGAGSEWGKSEIMKWLNDGFYNEAFTDAEKNRLYIHTTTLEDKIEFKYRVSLAPSSQLGKEREVRPDIIDCSPNEYVRSHFTNLINNDGTVDWWMKYNPYTENKNWTVNTAGSYESASGSLMRTVRPLIAISKKGNYSNVRPGDIIYFGTYKGEAIEWYVFKNSALNWSGDSGLEMISVKALDVKRFDAASGTEWEKSEIMKWLNDSFVNEAFTETERQLLRTIYTEFEDKTRVEFRISLPWSSQLEKEKQLKPDIMQCSPNAYVRSQYGNTIYVSEDGMVDWWIKWNPYSENKSWTVSAGGYKSASSNELRAVRPWIAITRK